MRNGAEERIIISGATGQLAGLVVEELLGRGVRADRLILVSRQPAKLERYAALGADVRCGDLHDPASLADAFAGGERLLLVSIGPGPDRLAAHKAGFDAAVASGVTNIVYTSFLGAEEGASPIAADHQRSERDLMASGATWTMLRNGFYADSFAESAVKMARSGRTTIRPGERRTAPVSRADAAAAAAGALLDPALSANRAFDITGPELYHRGDVAEAVSDMTGKPVIVTEQAEPPGPPLDPSDPPGPPLTTPERVTDDVATLSGRAALGLRALLRGREADIRAAARER